MQSSANNIFSMNMMRPRVLKRTSACSFMRNFIHYASEGELISSFTGTYTGGHSGTITCALGDNYSELGENIWVELYIGFSFAAECPGLDAATNTNSKTDGWYHYAKVDWWPGPGRVTEEGGIEAPTTSNTRTTVGYENLWEYQRWPYYGMIMNAATWVCIGTPDTLFATGEIIGSTYNNNNGPTVIPWEPSESGLAPAWDLCTKASCWDGSNASKRMMNMLSPKMSDSKFNEYTGWMVGRGCNTAHVFVCNRGDGEYAGYSIYGTNFNWSIDAASCSKMLTRITALRNAGMAVVLWLAADDSGSWNDIMAASAQRYIDDLESQGFLDVDVISTVVIGLEMTEYWDSNQATAMGQALRTKWSGTIGTHHNSYRYTYYNLGDILFFQVDPGTSTSRIIDLCNTARAVTGKPVNMFEMERNPDRAKCVAVLNSGAAFGVANW